MDNKDIPAFPRVGFDKEGTITSDFPDFNGLSKREYFAALVLQGILARPETGYVSNIALCEDAVLYADTLLEALNKPTDSPTP